MKKERKLRTPIKAIRAKCLDCCCGSYTEINLCTIKNCALYPYRMGKRPTKAILDTMKESYGEK